jgi:hypothetical protein
MCVIIFFRINRVLFVNLIIIPPFTGMQAQFFGPLMKVRLSNTGSVVGPYPFPGTGTGAEGGGKGEELNHGTSTAISGRNNNNNSGSGSGSGKHTRTSSAAAAASASASAPPSGVVLEANGFSGKFPIKGGVMSTISKATSFMSPSATAKVHASAAHGAYFCCVYLQLSFFFSSISLYWFFGAGSFFLAYIHWLLSVTLYLLTLLLLCVYVFLYSYACYSSRPS